MILVFPTKQEICFEKILGIQDIYMKSEIYKHTMNFY
jgi:hypothetical protein